MSHVIATADEIDVIMTSTMIYLLRTIRYPPLCTSFFPLSSTTDVLEWLQRTHFL